MNKRIINDAFINQDVIIKLNKKTGTIKAAILKVYPEHIIFGLQNGGFPGFKVIKNPLPDDVKIKSVYFNGQEGCFDYILTSESFQEVKYDERLPVLESPVLWLIKDDPQERLLEIKFLQHVNCDSAEGKLLVAAMGQLSSQPGYTDKTPDEILSKLVDIAREFK